MSAAESMTNLIPMVFVGGVAFKMLDTMMPQSPPPQRRKRRRRRDVYSRNHIGDFSNLGFR